MLGVRIFNPSDLVAVYSLVKMWEENLKMVQRSCTLNVMAIIGKNFPINQSKSFTRNNLSIQWLTPTQMKEKDERGYILNAIKSGV